MSCEIDVLLVADLLIDCLKCVFGSFCWLDVSAFWRYVRQVWSISLSVKIQLKKFSLKNSVEKVDFFCFAQLTSNRWMTLLLIEHVAHIPTCKNVLQKIATSSSPRQIFHSLFFDWCTVTEVCGEIGGACANKILFIKKKMGSLISLRHFRCRSHEVC